jgi:hypothetical protein
MSLIKIKNLFESESSVLTTIAGIELQNIIGGSAYPGFAPVYTPAPAPAPASGTPVPTGYPATTPNTLNTLYNNRTAISYAFGRATSIPTSRGNFNLTMGGGFTGNFGANGSNPYYTSGTAFDAVIPSASVVKK